MIVEEERGAVRARPELADDDRGAAIRRILAGLDPDPSQEPTEEGGGLWLRPLLRGDARDPAEVREGREGLV